METDTNTNTVNDTDTDTNTVNDTDTDTNLVYRHLYQCLNIHVEVGWMDLPKNQFDLKVLNAVDV